MGLSEWNIGRCSCGGWMLFAKPCNYCGTITPRPNEKETSEMNSLTNGGITIGSEANGETSFR